LSKRKAYTSEFKRGAVRFADTRGKLNAAARALGVHSTLIQRWKQDLAEHGERAFPGQGLPQDEELARLSRQLKRVEEENAILKKRLVSSALTLTEIPIHRRSQRLLRRFSHVPCAARFL
jgi:transposase